MAVILASGSPRRKQLLKREGIVFTVAVSDAEELTDPGNRTPAEMAESNAYAKASAIAAENPNDWIIGADTIVAGDDGSILGKPTDADDAFRILSYLSGTVHSVITGVAICNVSQIREIIFHETTRVSMRRMREDEIRAYIATGEPFGKAGAFAIQGQADQFIESIDGDFDNVVGLPVQRVIAVLNSVQ